MTATTAGVEMKGWCPGALRPMQSGDGLIVRIRPVGAELSVAAMRGIADAAARHGNGHIDLTRRANLQIRGVSEATLSTLQDALRALGLLDARPEAEAVRNLLLSPLAGLDPSEALDMRPLARDLAAMLADMPEAWALPAKFAFVLDGGGRLPLSGERADLRLHAVRTGRGEVRIAFGVDRAKGTDSRGQTTPDRVLGAVRWALRERLAEAHIGVSHRAGDGSAPGLSPLQAEALPGLRQACGAIPPIGPLAVDAAVALVGIGVPFGSLDAARLRALADIADDTDGVGVRLSPWRIFYIACPDGAASEHLMARARELGFVIDASDPLMRIQACPGRPACHAGHADTRADARHVASWMRASGFSGTAHISGCAKGCASSVPADLMLTGTPGGYRVARNARAQDEGGVFVAPGDLSAFLDSVHPAGGSRHD